MKYIVLYLLAIVLANLSSAFFGPTASIINAFLLIGLDLTARDKLHEAWGGKDLFWKMESLILHGSVLTLLVNRNAGQIAVASLVAFTVAAIVDTIFYHFFRKNSYMVRVNGSNVFSALADSIVFPTIAFGGFSILITAAQFLAKVVGGALWSFILMNKKERRDLMCKWGWHKYPLDWIDMTHEQCQNCKETWEFNPYWNV